ncbi:MAG: hypothetical protein JNJ53_14335 [Rhizobiales bacterium]|nr:hypothetical protein [Hyphomicrobiales bacterium]
MGSSTPTQVPPQAGNCDCATESASASDNPAAEVAVTAVRGGANMYGAFSIETFCDVGGLSLTHDDADGFLAYVRQFTAPNFWYQDAGVRVWAYYEQYDNWQDTYGMDAVCVAYHSGHGGMDGNGVFYVPMGSAWAGNDCTATSNNMRLGNEHVRYIFWSTCLSCRVLDGHSPIRTWQPANLGFRMLFGYETTSWDNPNYGRFFWEEWRKNKSFSQAWLDASWRIAHDQAPSATACGSSAADAQNRLYNERNFFSGAVSHDWWWWRWYYAAASARPLLTEPPVSGLVAQLKPVSLSSSQFRTLAEKFELSVPEASASADGSYGAGSADQYLAFGANGSVDAKLAAVNYANREPLASDNAVSIAQSAVGKFGLDDNGSLVLDRVLSSWDAGGTENGSGERIEPSVTSTTVQFRQVVNGIPIISQDSGALRVTVDNDGTVTNVHSSLQTVDALSERARSMLPTPPLPSGANMHDIGPEPDSYERALAVEFSRQLSRWGASGNMPLSFSTVPNSTEIGYEVKRGTAILVARRAIEVDFGRGYRKRYWVTVPLA